MFEMGVKVTDRVTGFTGAVAGRTEYFNGYVQYLVKPRVDDEGKMQDAHWIDSQQLEVTGEGVLPIADSSQTGGPSSDAPSENYAG